MGSKELWPVGLWQANRADFACFLFSPANELATSLAPILPSLGFSAIPLTFQLSSWHFFPFAELLVLLLHFQAVLALCITGALSLIADADGPSKSSSEENCFPGLRPRARWQLNLRAASKFQVFKCWALFFSSSCLTSPRNRSTSWVPVKTVKAFSKTLQRKADHAGEDSEDRQKFEQWARQTVLSEAARTMFGSFCRHTQGFFSKLPLVQATARWPAQRLCFSLGRIENCLPAQR